MNTKANFSAVIVAGGLGTRLGHSLPKAFVPLDQKPLFTHSLEIFNAHPLCQEIVLVIPLTHHDKAKAIVQGLTNPKPLYLVNGGTVRWESTLQGIKACTGCAPWVLIHDAARPFVTVAVINSLLELSTKYDGAISATPMVDTVRTICGDRSSGTLDRSTLVRVGTPQMFRRDVLMEVFSTIDPHDASITDEAMLFENAGYAVGIAQGDPLNFKITTPQDLLIAEALCAYRMGVK